jgi:hypothetical protein
MGFARVASLAKIPLTFVVVLLLFALPANSSAAPLFGRHFPHGSDAVAYLYGPNGTWREQTNVYYGWNFYKHCETPSHAHDPQALLRQASVTNTVAPDVNCLLLGDFNNNGEIADETIGGFAFHEHAGRGVRGAQTSPPFYQFWFDDNWIARYMAETYERPHPIGLHDFDHPLRWRVVGGDNRNWTPYPDGTPHIDQIALNGFYKFNARDFDGALAAWNAIRNASGATYDSARGRYRYSFETESVYYHGLWAILSERLLTGRAEFPQRAEVLQHAMSLRAALLELQERDASGNRLGWRTGTVERALINTETTSLAVLALGAHATWVLEPGFEPLHSGAGSFVRERQALTAVAGQSAPGYLVLGPYWALAPGAYEVEFSLRSTAGRIESPLATIDVHDGNSVVVADTIEAAEVPASNQWRRYRLLANIINAANVTQFRVYWHGAYDLDVGSIRVTRREAPTISSKVSIRAPQADSRRPRQPQAVPAPLRVAPKKVIRAPQWLRRIETYVNFLS